MSLSEGAPGMYIRTSPLIQDAAQARRPSAWWLAIAFACGVGVLATLFGFTLRHLAGPAASEFGPGTTIDLLIAALSLLMLFLWVRHREQRPFASIGFGRRCGPQPLLVGPFIGSALLGLPALLLVMTGRLVPSTPPGTTAG